MLIVTGGLACGKSTFKEAAEQLGYSVIDADDWFKEWISRSENRDIAETVLGSPLADAAFKHPQWDNFIALVDAEFGREFIFKILWGGTVPDILIIPDYFSRNFRFPNVPVLTIECDNALNYALKRDPDRPMWLTDKIFHSQMPAHERSARADYTLKNVSLSKEGFRELSKLWLVENFDRVKK